MRTRLLKMAAKLSAEQRNSLPDSAFALPGRRFPINDANHARAAISMASRGTTPEEAAKVRAAVHRRYPELGKTAEVNLKHILRDKDRDGRTRYESRIQGDSTAREKFLTKLKERDALLNHPAVRERVLRYMNRKRGKSPGMFYFDEDAKAWTPHSVASRVPKGSTEKERQLNKVYTPTVLGARMLGNEHFPQTAPGEPRQGPSDWKTTRLTDAYISRLRSEIWGPKLDNSRP